SLEFEGLLVACNRQGSYAGIENAHLGPAHLSIGQEAAAVGQAAALTVDDHIFGSHRSHGEILAKSLAAISAYEPAALTAELAGFREGASLALLEAHLESADDATRAVQFLLYG